MYAPTGVMFIAPFFNIDLNANANFIVFCSFLYPGLDPLILIFIIRDFRQTIFSERFLPKYEYKREYLQNLYVEEKRTVLMNHGLPLVQTFLMAQPHKHLGDEPNDN